MTTSQPPALFGLKNLGVNLVSLEPGARSSMRHWHTRQDEFVYVIGASYPDVDPAMHSESGAMKFTRKDGRSFE
jgi:hypothetical protein